MVNGLYALDTLETYAHNIVPTLPGTDPIEVYLGLPVKFKDEFNIPIAIADMLYFACSGLKDEHIENAREALKENLEDEGKVLDFLVEQPKWLEALEATHKKRWML